MRLPVLPLLLLLGTAAAANSAPKYSHDASFTPSYAANASAVTGVSSCAVGTGADTHVYVGQRGKHAPPILVLDGKTGKVVRGMGSGLVGNMHGLHMQSLPNGTQYLWMTDSAHSLVRKFNPATGKLLATLGSKGTALKPAIEFGSVADIAFDTAGAIYISDGDGGINSRIMKLDSGAP